MTFYDPEIWLESMLRGIKEYSSDAFNRLVLDNVNNPVGLYDPDTNPDGVYEVVMEFPNAIGTRIRVPLHHNIIHFEVDNIEDRPVGIGKNIFEDNYDSLTQTYNPQEAREHRVSLDVGIWSSDDSGGTTGRMRAYQALINLFQGSLAQDALDAATYGNDGRIEILQFTGGRFIIENINDVPTYRMVDGTLEVRVFSRTPLSAIPAPTIEEIVQSPGLTISS